MMNKEEDQSLNGGDGHSEKRVFSEQVMVCGNYAEKEVLSGDSGKRMGKPGMLLERWGGVGRWRGFWRGFGHG